jgi:hypothetical protein
MGRSVAIAIIVMLAGAWLGGCAADRAVPAAEAATLPIVAAAATQSADPAWAEISEILARNGVLRDGVYCISVSRDDLDVRIEGMDVPSAAGLESLFWFYRCSCGKMNVVGQFIIADYEANDVIDALRAGQLKVAAAGPALLYEKPRLLLIRFQGEGQATSLAKIIREALRWTGKERMAPRKAES